MQNFLIARILCYMYHCATNKRWNVNT